MKQFNLWFILALIAVLAMTCASQLKTDNTYTTVLTDTIPDRDTIKLEDILLYTDRDGVMYFDTNKTKHLHGFTGDSIVHYYGYLFDVGEHNELRFQRKITTDYKYKGKITTYFYSLYHKGFFCKKVAANFEAKDNQLFSASISKYKIDADTTIKIPKNKIINIAKDNLEEKIYAWEEKGWENFASQPNPQLIVKEISKNNYRLVYEGYFTVLPLKTYLIHIDAETGKIHSKRWNGGNCSGCQNCNNEVAHNGVIPLNYQNLTESIWIKQCSTSTGQCNKLKQTDNHKIDFVSMLSGPPPQEICWETGSNIPSDTILSAYWAVQTSYDYFASAHNYLGVDGTNTDKTSVLLDVGDNSSFSYGATGFAMALGTGNPPNKPWITLDAVGHEVTHGIDKNNADLNSLPNYSEGLIILEGFCDIMGIAVEATKKGTNDWAIQNDFALDEIRYMNTPDSSILMGVNAPQPKYYNGNNWLGTSAVHQTYIHHNNGVMNFWFYLLSEGTNGTYTNEVNQSFSFDGIGIDSATEIVFRSLTVEFSKNDYPVKDFQNLRKATMKVAENEYGCNGNVWEIIRQAWDAVGVTNSTCEEAVKTYTVCISPSICVATITMCGDMNNPRVIVRDLTTNTNVYNNKPNGALTLSNLVCGRTYKVTVKDKNNPLCEDVIKYFTCQSNNPSTGSINVCPPSVEFWASPNIINNCDDNNDINLSVTGGIPPYSYIWSNGSNSQNLTNIASGTYSVTVVDNCYNSVTRTVTVNGYPALNVSGQMTYSACNNMPPPPPHHDPGIEQPNTVSIILSLTGGQTPYTYNWSNGLTTQNLADVPTGNYSVTITDANNCSKTLSFSGNTPLPNIHAVSITDACPLSDDGAIINNVVGGTPPYTFTWNGPGNAQSVQNPTGLKAGTHYVTVTDANGCTDEAVRFIPTAPYTYVDDLSNCERVYTCHSNTYSEDMLDYNNIDRNFEDCEGTIPCSLTGGSPQTVQGSINHYAIGGFFQDFPKCEHYCVIDGVGDYARTPDNPITFGPPLAGYSSSCDGGDGTQYAVYCDGGFAGHWCDDQDIHISLVLSFCPNCLPPPPIAMVSNGNNGIINFSPNPFNEFIDVNFESDYEDVTIRLINIVGQEIENQVISTHKGTNYLKINFQNELTNGIYLLQVQFPDGKVYSKKVIHQH